MLLQKKFQKAVAIVGRMTPGEVVQLKKICREIQAAEERLLAASTELIQRCVQSCGGLCCRNLHSGQIIDIYDFVFILTAAPAMKPRIRNRVGHQPVDFTADCVFLENGVGPCIFPFNTRPEVCITSFCGREELIGAEIRQVTRRFAGLRRFVLFQKPRRLQRRLQRLIPGRRPPAA